MVQPLALASAPIPIVQSIVEQLKDGAAQRRCRLINRHWNNVIMAMYNAGHLNRVRLHRFVIEYLNTLHSYWKFGNSTDPWERRGTKSLSFCTKSFPPDPSLENYDRLDYIQQSAQSIIHKFSNMRISSFERNVLDYSKMKKLYISSCDCSSVSSREWFELAKLLVNIKSFVIELGWEPENCGSLVKLKDRVFWQLASYRKLTRLIIEVRKFEDYPTVHAETIRQRKSKLKRICISQT